MGWIDVQYKKLTLERTENALLKDGWIEKKVDNNNDNIYEAVQTQTKDSKTPICTEYDFDTNGATDYKETYDYNGKIISQSWFTNTPEDNQIKEPNLLDKISTFFKKNKLDKDLEKAPEITHKSMEEISKEREELYNLLDEIICTSTPKFE